MKKESNWKDNINKARLSTNEVFLEEDPKLKNTNVSWANRFKLTHDMKKESKDGILYNWPYMTEKERIK